MSSLTATAFTTEECLNFERKKNEKLQYFLVNSVKMISELEAQLVKARKELTVARHDANSSLDELNLQKKKFVSSKSIPRREKNVKDIDEESSEYSDEEDIDQSSMNKKRKQTHQEQQKAKNSSASKALVSYNTIRPINSRVEQAIESVSTALSNPHINTPARDFLFKFVCRIFDGGDVFYGYLVSYNRLHFQVVYSDGDTQRLGMNEVRLSLVDESQVPKDIASSCKKHYEKGAYMSRTPLPTIS